MLILNVAEKNDAAKTISNLLSNGHVNRSEGKSKFNKIYQFKYNMNGESNDMMMTSVSGHMMNLQFPLHLKNWETVDPLILFDSPVNKVCTENMIPIKKSLEDLIKKCNMLIIWTDCDREGENIGMEVVDTCLAIKSNIVIKRAKFSEITTQSVRRAINNLVDMNLRLSQAVDVRQEFDLKLGAAFTRLQTLFLQKRFPQLLSNQVISYGSCQFPTMGFVVERYKEVENFIAEPFWKIILTHEKKLDSVEFNWDRMKLFDENLVSAILENITDGGSLACVIDVINKPKSKWRPFAMDTIEMEKLASRKLKINPKTTMQIAEKLYSKSFISYPRTETNIFPKDMNLEDLVGAQVSDERWGAFASQLLAEGVDPHNGKKTDQAHPPIHPLKQGIGLQGDESRLFELITRHFLACLSKNALGHETKILVDCVSRSYGQNNWSKINNRIQRSGLGEGFSITGLAILERNYLEVYPYDKWSDKEVPLYDIGEIFSPTSVSMDQGCTSAPFLLTEADLITLMDKHGIGTDATHAEHIDKVKTREYVGNTGPGMVYLIPGKLGMGLVEGYDLMGFFLARPNLRSKFEADLEQICQGNKQPEAVLNFHLNEYKRIYQETVNQIDKLKEGVAKFLDEVPTTESDFRTGFLQPNVAEAVVRACPCCEGIVNIRMSNSNTWFLGCSRYPTCKHVLWLPSIVDNVVLAKSESDDSIVECQNYHDKTRNIPVNKLSIKFNTFMGFLANIFPDEQRRFVVCLYCNDEVCEALNIRNSAVKPSSFIQNQSIRSTNQSLKPLSTNQCQPNKTIKPEVKLDRTSQTSQKTMPLLPDNNTVCHCGTVACVRQVNKEGPNKGRYFYTCPSSTCPMFAWVNETVSGKNKIPSHQSFASSRENPPPSAGNESAVMCNCGKNTKLFTVRKENQNKGRQFYGCTQSTRCSFFQWSDEPRSSNESTPQSNRKRNVESFSSFTKKVKVSSDTEMMWPPAAHQSKSNKAKQKVTRCCSICKQPGHTAKTCSSRNV